MIKPKTFVLLSTLFSQMAFAGRGYFCENSESPSVKYRAAYTFTPRNVKVSRIQGTSNLPTSFVIPCYLTKDEEMKCESNISGTNGRFHASFIETNYEKAELVLRFGSAIEKYHCQLENDNIIVNTVCKNAGSICSSGADCCSFSCWENICT